MSIYESEAWQIHNESAFGGGDINMTDYVVLRQNGSGWVMVTNDGSVSATGPRQAIKAATAKLFASGSEADNRSGTFVAVPARSWKPERRRIDTVEREVWE